MIKTSLDNKGQLQVQTLAPPAWRDRIDAAIARNRDSGSTVAAVPLADLVAMGAHLLNTEELASRLDGERHDAEARCLDLLEELHDAQRALAKRDGAE